MNVNEICVHDKKAMSFNEFQNIPEVQKRYVIKYRENNFIVSNPVTLTKNFQEEFDFNLENMDIFASEAA